MSQMVMEDPISDTGQGRSLGGGMSSLERAVWIAGGGLLALQGARRGGWPGAALAAAGVGLAIRGLSDTPVLEQIPLPRSSAHPDIPGVDERRHPVTFTHSITIGRPREELYRFWRNFPNLSRVLPHVRRIDMGDSALSHWTVDAPGGRVVEWDAEIHEDRQNERIAWRSVGQPDIHNSGVIEFRDAPGDRGTEVRVTLRYEPPFGRLGRGIAMLTGKEPQRQAYEALYRFKQIMETGAPVTVEGQPSGRHRSLAS